MVAKLVKSFVDLILTGSVSEGFGGILRPSLTLRVVRIPLLAANHLSNEPSRVSFYPKITESLDDFRYILDMRALRA